MKRMETSDKKIPCDSQRKSKGAKDLLLLTLSASSSALCLAVFETDLSANNLARKNSIVIKSDFSMLVVFLEK